MKVKNLKTSISKQVNVDVEKKASRCNICDANFAEKGTLVRHVTSVHEGKKPFKCNICETSFAKKHHLKRHVASIHEKTKP